MGRSLQRKMNVSCELSGEEQREILDAAMQAGHILLENGAEIFRVEETIDRICHYYGIESGNAFVLSNGIFITSGNEREEIFAKVQHIPVSGVHLNRVAAVNQLSREIVEGRYTIGEVRERLDEIRVMPGKTKTMQILASGVGSACFCMLFGGNFMERGGFCVGRAPVFLRAVYQRPTFIEDCGKYRRRCTGDLSLFRDVSAFRRAALEFHDYRFHHASGAGSGVYQRHTGYR